MIVLKCMITSISRPQVFLHTVQYALYDTSYVYDVRQYTYCVYYPSDSTYILLCCLYECSKLIKLLQLSKLKYQLVIYYDVVVNKINHRINSVIIQYTILIVYIKYISHNILSFTICHTPSQPIPFPFYYCYKYIYYMYIYTHTLTLIRYPARN